MSPSEFDLRAALRDGEDDGRPDVDGLIAHVRDRRAQRRTRVLSTAAAVVVVAAAAVGGAAVWGGSDGGGQQAGRVSNAPTAGGSQDASPEPASSGSDTVAADPGCPASTPTRLSPGLAPPRSTAGRMFGAPVRSVLVCAYSEAGSSTATAAPLVLEGSNATALTDSIENASRSKLKIMCPDIVAAEKKQLVIIATSTAGARLPTVTTDVSIPNCNEPITNGTAVRYAWKPPASVAPLISALTTRTGRSLPTPGGGSGMNGSPAR